ncbi:MAG: UDP-N-acetylmuramoyl-tripeptide--D-alanyl-D-alanine ligase [Acidobacteriota bacterium]
MPELRMDEIAAVMGGVLKNSDGKDLFTKFVFDTREISEQNTLFFALRSETGDGHRFIPQLEKVDGAGAVVSKDFDIKNISIPLIIVEDTLKSAHKLASYLRGKFRKTRYVGITGSAGKTTTKEFLAQLLSTKFKVFRSHKNWNNWIGLPFSIFQMDGDEDVAIFELAMSYPGIGEIDLLADILKPDIAVILNVFPVHLEFLKNLKNIAKGKSEILNYLNADGTAFISGDSEFIKNEVKNKKGRKFFFGQEEGGNDIILKDIIRSKNKSSFFINFFGVETRFEANIINRIHIENLFAAIIIAQDLGMKNFEIAEALALLEPVSGRGSIESTKKFTIIDETYNSNPVALKKTLQWVDREFEGNKIAVVGDMLELGEEEDRYHAEIGQFFSDLGYSQLICVGKRAEKIVEGALSGGYPGDKIKAFENSPDAGSYINEYASEGSIILFKASRGIRLEGAIEKVKNG